MDPVVDAILRRRSVREGLTDAPVPVGIVEDIVRCGLAAPSSKNARPWRFHIVADRLLLDELAGAVENSEDIETYVPFDPATGKPRPECSSSVIESASILRSAPLAIFIENTGVFSRGRQALAEATPEALASSMVGYTFEVIGLGAAIQNMWIAAVAHGVSGVFLGDVLIAERAIQKRLSIASDLVGVLALGYSDASESRARQRDFADAGRVVWHSSAAQDPR